MRAGDKEMQEQGQVSTDFIVGLDIAKAKVDVALRLPNGKWRSKVVANTVAGFQELVLWLGKHDATRAHVCMEATGSYWEAIAEHLSDAGYAVSVVNPAQIKAYGAALGVRSKTDAADAKLIAEFCAARPPALWQAPPPAVRQLRALVARREALIELRIQETNRLEVAHDSVRASIEDVVNVLQEQIRQIEQRIRQHIDDDPTLKGQRDLLDSVPGLGDATIPILLGHYGGPVRFATARQAVAFAGLDVCHYESGSSVHGRPRLSKRGNSRLRKAMYMPALVSMRLTPWGKTFAARLAAAGKPKMVILGAIMRKLVQIAYAILRTGKKFDPTMHSA
jgi:transposase